MVHIQNMKEIATMDKIELCNGCGKWWEFGHRKVACCGKGITIFRRKK